MKIYGTDKNQQSKYIYSLQNEDLESILWDNYISYCKLAEMGWLAQGDNALNSASKGFRFKYH